MIIHNVRIVFWGDDGEIASGKAVRIQDGRIVGIDEEKALIAQYPDDEKLDGNNQLLMPGNICAHTHFYGAYARGMAIPGEAPKDFPQILEKLWWPLDKALDEASVRHSARIHLINAIRNGTTSLIDHHASPNFIDGSLDAIADEIEASGLRAVLCYEVTDRDGEEKAQAGIRENLRFLQKVNETSATKERIGAAFGLHASLTLSDETLRKCADVIPEGAAFHIHVAEHEADQEDSLKKSGKRVVSRLNSFGILNSKSILAHVVHVDETEIEIIAQTKARVSHQARSNMNNGVGAADVEKLLQSGVLVCLGNDGFTQDMWSEWKSAYLLHKLWHRDPRKMNGMDIVQMAVHNNATLISSFFEGQEIGQIKEGSSADLILVDYHPFTELSIGNLPWQILFGFHESMITMTIVAGEVLMKDRKILTMDEEKIASDALQEAPNVWKRYAENVASVQ